MEGNFNSRSVLVVCSVNVLIGPIRETFCAKSDAKMKTTMMTMILMMMMMTMILMMMTMILVMMTIETISDDDDGDGWLETE